MTNPSTEAREAATILDRKLRQGTLYDFEELASIIQSALDSAQRPYVEWIMNTADHHRDCSLGATRHCNCGLQKLRDELRKQVGGES